MAEKSPLLSTPHIVVPGTGHVNMYPVIFDVPDFCGKGYVRRGKIAANADLTGNFRGFCYDEFIPVASLDLQAHEK